MNSDKDLKRITDELINTFPESKVSESGDISAFQTIELYFSKGKKVALKFSKDYLEQLSFEDFKKHLQRNIYYVTLSNFNKTIYLMKNFEIEVANEMDTPAVI